MKPIYYHPLDIQNAFFKLTNKGKIDILSKALVLMDKNRTYSKTDCIAYALGYKNIEGLDHKYTFN